MSLERAIEQAVEQYMPLARRLAERFHASGVDPDALESDATMALWAAARRAAQLEARGHKVKNFQAFATSRIRLELFKSVRDAPFAHLADVPIRLREAAEKCERAGEALLARGIRRPSAEQLAGEAGIAVWRADAVLSLTTIVPRQSAIEWADNTGSTAVRNPVASLEPTFGVRSFTPESGCPHYGPIPMVSKLVCMVCHATGFDHHPLMKRTLASDPLPEPEPEDYQPPVIEIKVQQHRTETRAVRRQRLFATAKGDQCSDAT